MDPNIEENCIVSIYGIFTLDAFENLEFTCKGGMVRAFGALREAGRVNTQYIYKFGFGELSKATESIRYSSTIEGIEELEKDMLWTYSGNDIGKIEERTKESFVEEDTTVDFANGGQFFIDTTNGEVTKMNY